MMMNRGYATKYSGSVRVHGVWNPLLRDVNDIPCGLHVTSRSCSRYGRTVYAGRPQGDQPVCDMYL